METRAATNQAIADSEAFMIATFANHSDAWAKGRSSDFLEILDSLAEETPVE